MTDNEHETKMARPRMAAGALFFDASDRLLLVEPSYKDYQDIPGGYVEQGESPREACVREVREELGIEPSIGRLLVVDWAPNPGEGDKVLYLFDGGRLHTDHCQPDRSASERASGLRLPQRRTDPGPHHSPSRPPNYRRRSGPHDRPDCLPGEWRVTRDLILIRPLDQLVDVTQAPDVGIHLDRVYSGSMKELLTALLPALVAGEGPGTMDGGTIGPADLFPSRARRPRRYRTNLRQQSAGHRLPTRVPARHIQRPSLDAAASDRSENPRPIGEVTRLAERAGALARDGLTNGALLPPRTELTGASTGRVATAPWSKRKARTLVGLPMQC